MSDAKVGLHWHFGIEDSTVGSVGNNFHDIALLHILNTDNEVVGDRNLLESLLIHDVAGLEIAIEKRLHLLLGEVVGKHAEVCLQLELVEVDIGGLEETILEIVEVEEHTVGIKLRLGIALCEI